MADAAPGGTAGLLALMAARWEELQTLVDASMRATTFPPPADGWDAKAHLGHVTAWERSLLALLRGQDRSAAMGVPAEIAAGHDVDRINAFVAARTASLPLSEVRREAHDVHAELVALLATMSDADLALPYSHYQPNDPPYNERPVAGWIAGNTFEHYDEHIGWLGAHLDPS